MNKRILTIPVLTFLLVFSLGANAQLNYGLKFRSTPSNIAERTSFNLIEEGDFTFRKSFNLSFEFCLDNPDEFGYICHLIEGTDEICLMYFPHGSDDYSYFDIIIKGKERLLRLPLEKNELNNEHWHRIQLSFFLDTDSIKLSVGDITASGPFKFDTSYSPTIVFGTYKTSMVLPTISIKDIKLHHHLHDELVHYPLNEYSGSTAIETKGRQEIEIRNPDWLAKKHYNWKHEHTVVTSPMAANCFIPERNEIYLLGPDSLLIYNIESNTFYSLKYANEFPLTPLHNDVAHNPIKGKIDAYGFINGSGDEMDKRIASLDLKSLKWMEPKLSNRLSEHCHHNSMVIEGVDYPVIFGGYGSLKYYSKFISYNPLEEKWQDVRFSGDSISPRFLASISQKVDQKYYLFGGFGNESGDQELGGINFYDLYEIDTQNKSIDKIGEMPKPDNDFVGANTMVFDKKDSVLFVLGYAHHQQHTNLVLYRFNYQKNTVEIVSDSISSSSQTIYSKKNLFYSEESGKLIAVIREDPGTERTVFKYYSLHFPPIVQKVVREKLDKNWFVNTRVLFKILAALAFVVSLFFIIYFKIKKRKDPEQALESPFLVDLKQLENIIPSRNVILFFGEFVALNSKGENISHLFAPRLRQLLFLILAYQIKDKEGISSHLVSKTLWPDKELVESKNIRSVTISHLRNALKGIEGVGVIFENRNWRISTTNSVFIDLVHFSDCIYDRLFDSSMYGEIEFLKFLKYSSRGNMGLFLGEEWADGTRFEIDSMVIDTLQAVMAECSKVPQHFKLGLFASSSILKIAPFNENAIQYKLRFLISMGEIDSAESVFENFSAKYKKHFNQKPHWSFHEITKKAL